MIKHVLVAAMLVAAVLGAAETASAQDKAIKVPDTDREMNDAIAKATKTLPHFWERFANPGPGETGFALKVALKDKNGVEHFWLTDIERKNGVLHGTIDNTP